MSEHTYAVSGMTCQHCVQNVQNKLSAVEGVQSARVQLLPPRAVVNGSAPLSALQSALADTKFTIAAL